MSEATVTFFAKLTQNETDLSFKEKSFFKREKKRWYYFSGEIIS